MLNWEESPSGAWEVTQQAGVLIHIVSSGNDWTESKNVSLSLDIPQVLISKDKMGFPAGGF